jgi:hypothetical protein
VERWIASLSGADLRSESAEVVVYVKPEGRGDDRDLHPDA